MGGSSVGRDESRTPSPATSLGRGSLFRRSSESSSSTKSRTSYSAESKSKKDSRNKSVFSSLFKKGGSAREKECSKDDITGTTARRRRSGDYDSRHSGLDPKITNVEFTFNQDRGGIRNTGPDSIVIPLHSPDSVVEPLMVYDPETETMVDMHLEEEPRVRLPQPTTTTSTVSKLEQITSDASATDRDSKSRKHAPFLPQQQSSSSVSEKAILVSADVITHQAPEDMTEKKVERKPNGITPTPSVIVSPKSPRTTPTSSVISPRSPKTTPTYSQISPGSSQRSQLKESSPGSGELLPEVLKLLPPEMMTKSSEGSKEGSVRDGKERLSGGSDDRKNSSESEQDSDAVLIPSEEHPGVEDEEDDQEKKTLVHQPDSLEDELPYVPTTLPQERSVAHPIIPVKQRVSEVKTYPIERPRSTTPINPATLDDYVMPYDESVQTWDKMQITLPRTDSIKSEGRSKSPGRGKSRTQLSQKGLSHSTEKPIRVSSAGPSPHGGRESRRKTPPTPPSPPPLPPRATTAWVSFDEVPERRRTPKRITTLPSSTQQHSTPTTTSYNYVNPEECSCECHDSQHRGGGAASMTTMTTSSTSNQCGVSGSDSRQHKTYSKTRTSSASYRTN